MIASEPFSWVIRLILVAALYFSFRKESSEPAIILLMIGWLLTLIYGVTMIYGAATKVTHPPPMVEVLGWTALTLGFHLIPNLILTIPTVYVSSRNLPDDFLIRYRAAVSALLVAFLVAVVLMVTFYFQLESSFHYR